VEEKESMVVHEMGNSVSLSNPSQEMEKEFVTEQ
jgi:hypothetical protein